MQEGPDKGWAWMVAFAACGINFIMAGLGRMSGILYVAFIDIYGVDRKGASLPFSVRSSTRNLLGPVVGILGQKYGVQVVIVCGSIMATISSALCFFAKDIGWITILWGGLSGIGTALTTVLVQVVIGQYFKKYRTTAAGMGFSGGCVGSFLFPALMEWLLNNYGIGGTFLIISGIIMHTIPAAMILRKPLWLKRKSDPKSAVVKIKNDQSMNSTTETENLSRKDPDIQFLRENTELLVKMLTVKTDANNLNAASLEINEEHSAIVNEIGIIRALESIYASLESSGTKKFYDNLAFLENEEIDVIFDKEGIKSVYNHKTGRYELENTLSTKCGGNTNGNWAKRNSASDISNDISKRYVFQKIKSLLDMESYQISPLISDESDAEIQKAVTQLRNLFNACAWSRHGEHNGNFQKENSAQSPGKNSKNKKSSNSFWDHIKTAFRMFGNPLFLMVCMARMVHFLTFLPVVTTIVDFAIDRGFRADEGIYVIAALSLGDLMGRLCLGWVTDKGFLTVPRYMLFGMILQGVNTATIPLMSAKAAIYVSLCVFGILQGSLFVRHPILVQKYISSKAQSIAMGCINFFPGILGLGLPLYIGYFRDTLGTYNPIFYINGAIGTLVGILWSLEQYFLRYFPEGS